MSSRFQDFVVVPQGPVVLSRRRVITVAAATAGGLVAGWPDDEAEANPLAGAAWWAARTALGGAISWFVGRMLERLITSDAEELGLRHTPNPQPSPDAFHNRLAEPFTITNPRYHISSAYSDRGNCYVDVGDHVRTSRSSRRDPYGDLNMPEMLCSRDEFEGLLIPAGKRSSASPTDGQFVAACRKLGRNPDELQLQYVRPFLVVGSAAGKIPVQAQVSSQAQYGGKARVQTVVGFGVTKQNGGQRQLLVVG